jgi:hypothetical protein
VKPKDPINEAYAHVLAALPTLSAAVLDNPARQSRAATIAKAELEKAIAELEKVEP